MYFPYDFNNIFFYVAYFIVRINKTCNIQNMCQSIVYIISKAPNQQQAISKVLGGVKNYTQIFDCMGVGAPKLCYSGVNCSYF